MFVHVAWQNLRLNIMRTKPDPLYMTTITACILIKGYDNSPWWRHQIETIPALLAVCERNLPMTGEFPLQRPVTRNFDIFFDLRLKRLGKQLRRR